MKKTLQFNLLVICSICSIVFSISHQTQAQNIFWSENFANGIPADWSNYDVSNPNAEWLWDDDPTANLFFPQPPFSAISANNGFALFDSDAFPLAHDVRLETDAIDCSGQNTVIIHFENQYDYFNTTAQATLEVSTDSNTWTSYNLFTGHSSNNHREHVQIEEIDISTVAANASTVYLRFRWVGNKEYIWRLDDILLQDSFSPPIANDITFGAMALAPNFKTPIAHIKPLELGGDIKNLGTNTAHNVKLYADIIKTTTDSIYFSDSLTISSISAGDSVLASLSFQPVVDTGIYEIVYRIKMDSSDQRRWNDRLVVPFEVTDSLFQKSFEYSFTSANVGGQPYEIGNIYEIQSSNTYVDKVFFTAISSLPLMNKTVDIKIYEIESQVDLYFTNFTNDNAILVGEGTYTFTPQDQDFAEMVCVDVKTKDSDPPTNLALKGNGTRYFVMVSFNTAGNSNDIRIGLDDSFRYEFELATIIKLNNNWQLGGFGPNYTAVVSLQTTQEDGVNTSNIEIEDKRIEIFPNPVTTDYLNISFDLKRPERELTVQITDVLGRYLSSEIVYNIQKDNISIDVKGLVAGTYFLNVMFDNGQRVDKTFIVE